MAGLAGEEGRGGSLLVVRMSGAVILSGGLMVVGAWGVYFFLEASWGVVFLLIMSRGVILLP